ncbi:MAG: PilZ domain-containing protein [Defluviitaleaceae bacterium]|nr:PilZ domain-containing protein [Defluviitaleaceae bacterium]
MHLRFIDDGTRLDIRFLSDDLTSVSEECFAGTFAGIEKGVTFLVQSDQLVNSSHSLVPSRKLNFTLYRGAEAYSFNGKIDKTHTKNGSGYLLVTAVSLIEKSGRRQSVRSPVSASVNLYTPDPNAPDKADKLLCAGMLHDISRDGLCFFTNEKIDIESNQNYVAEFTLVQPETIFLPVKLVRCGNCAQYAQYKYDYAFLYTCDKNAAEIDKLALNLFQYAMRV